jgi:hypothetical protein
MSSDLKTRLPRAAEELFGNWPVPGADRDWEDAADDVLTRIKAVRPKGIDEALVAAPLPAEPGERGQEPKSAPSSPSSPSVSLAELARQVASQSPEDNRRDIVRESLSVASRSRAQTPLIAESVRQRAAELATKSGKDSSPSNPTPSSPMASSSIGSTMRSAVAPNLPPKGKRRKKRSNGPLVAIAFAAIGLVAAVVIVGRSMQPSGPTAVALNPTPEPAAAELAAAPAEPEKSDPEVVSPDQLPATGEARPEEPPEPVEPKAGAEPPAKVASAERKPAEPAAEPKEIAQGPPPAAPAPKPEDDDSKLKPAAQPTGNAPEKPSTGAAQAAVASVIGSARACVAGHEEASRATIVFGSDGRVQSVSVSGPAAGTPAEACIRAALGRARVEPFTRPSYSVGATVRP